MGRVLFRGESPSFELGLEGALANHPNMVSFRESKIKWKEGEQWEYSGSLPWCELISSSHILHDLFQGLFVLDIHAIADVPLTSPVVDHSGGDAPPRGGAPGEKVNPRNDGALIRRLLSLLCAVARWKGTCVLCHVTVTAQQHTEVLYLR